MSIAGINALAHHLAQILIKLTPEGGWEAKNPGQRGPVGGRMFLASLFEAFWAIAKSGKEKERPKS